MNSDLSHLQSRMKALETKISADSSQTNEISVTSSINMKRQQMKQKMQQID